MIISGKEYNVVNEIGKGMFSIAYMLDNGKVLILEKTDPKKTNDTSKQVYCELDNIPHIPQIKYIGQIIDRDDRTYNAYIMPYYRALYNHMPAFDDFAIINSLVAQAKNKAYGLHGYDKFNGETWTNELLEIAKGKIKDSLYNALIAIIGGFSKYGLSDHNLDIAPSNFAIDDNGNLILLDIFCNVKALQDWR